MEEIWTLDYEAEGPLATTLKRAMKSFFPRLKADPRIQRMEVFHSKRGKPFRLRVNIVSIGNPFIPDWPPAFGKTQVGEPTILRLQPDLSIAKR